MELNKKILVIGDIMIDHYIIGNCTRISPEAPVQVVNKTLEKYLLGGAGNVLNNVISLNNSCDLISISGNDSNSQLLEELLQKLGNSKYSLFKEDERQTTLKTRVMVHKQQLLRIDSETLNEISTSTQEKVLQYLDENILDYEIVLISDYNKGFLGETFLQNVFNLCNRHQILSIVDPKGNNFNKYKNCGIIKPNRSELKILTGMPVNTIQQVESASVYLKQLLNCSAIIVTLSEDGMFYLKDNTSEHIPTLATEVFDVTGAGDTVLSSLGFCLAYNYSFHDACAFANAAASVVVRKVGSATATLPEINSLLN